MKRGIVLITALVIVTIIIAGCVTQTSTFNFGELFTAKEGSSYVSQTKGIHLQVTNFTDSRCPQGVQCVWAGERGLDATLYLQGDPALFLGTLHLGEITAKTTDTNLGLNSQNYEVELVTIDTDNNNAVLIVREKQNPLQKGERQWFSIDPKQCKSNEWDAWSQPITMTVSEEISVTNWLSQKYEILVYDSSSKRVTDIVCEACSCSTGERIAVLVDSNNKIKMLELGFTQMSPIACTMEAKVCPDGGALGRTAPFCEFEACPGT